MRILINAVSAKMGGAVNYLRELAHQLSGISGYDFIFLVPPELVKVIRETSPDFAVLGVDAAHRSFWRRLWFDQVGLRRILRDERIDVLFSTANLGILNPPCRQVLLVRNSLHFNDIYLRQIVRHKPLLARVQNRLRRELICASVRSSDVVMTPSVSMLSELRQFVNVKRAIVNPYGVNAARFAAERGFVQMRDPEGLAADLHLCDPPDMSSRLERSGAEGSAFQGPEQCQSCKDPVSLVFTSLYGEHKNIGTAFEAMLQLHHVGFACKLITTCDPQWEGAGQQMDAIRAKDLRLAASLREKGIVEFTEAQKGNMAPLYHRGDIFVYPSVVESFGHPLLEAMAAGLPVVAADVPINRELCAEAALYFSPFDSGNCATLVRRLAVDSALRQKLVIAGHERVDHFRWEQHVKNLLDVFSSLASG